MDLERLTYRRCRVVLYEAPCIRKVRWTMRRQNVSLSSDSVFGTSRDECSRLSLLYWDDAGGVS